jgi:hypothetical protein
MFFQKIAHPSTSITNQSIQKEGKISEKIMVAYKRFQSKIGLAHIACVAPTSVC